MRGPAARLSLAVAATVFIIVVLIAATYSPQPRTVTSVTTVVSTITNTVTSTASVTDTIASNATVTVNVTQTRPYALIVKQNTTITGNAVSLPGCAVRLGCTSSASQSSSAMLILYQGNYYYVSNYTETGSYHVVYTVWYTNSTEFCISPAVSWDPVCPNALFIQTSPSHTTTSTSVSCTVSGEGGPLYVQVVTDGGAPVQDQPLMVVQAGPTINGQPCGTVVIPTLFTNSTGWVEVPSGGDLPYAGSFSISLVYSGMSYNATVAIEPVTVTYLAFYLPSGRTSTTNCPFDSCPTYSDSMSMGG